MRYYSLSNGKKKEDLVSIIMPTYNCGKYIGIAIDSVIAQTYQNWELIIVDDCSTDNSVEVIESYRLKDKRIKFYRLNVNSGAAAARNKAISEARGKYMAFLDSDDIWTHDKLTKQINYMKANNYNFTCTSYRKIDENGDYLNKIIRAKPKLNYNGVLKYCPGNSTVIYNVESLGKFKALNIKKRNDYVLWLQIMKKEKYLYGLNETLGYHRVRAGSISSNKISLLYYHWKIYRKIEKLSIGKSILLLFHKVVSTVFNLR